MPRTSASAASSSACRSRWMICVETGVGLEPEALAREPLELRVGRGVGADRARELSDAHRLERSREAPARRGRARRPSRRASRPNVVGSACTPCVRPMQMSSRCSPRLLEDRVLRPLEPRQQERACRADLERERRVDDVGRGQPVMNPAPVRARRRPRRRPRDAARSCCVSRSSSATRSGLGGCARSRISATTSAGTAPSSAQASRAASSTSSQRASLLSPTRPRPSRVGSSARSPAGV